MRNPWTIPLAGLLACGSVGCGGSDGPKQVSLDEVRRTELTELGEVLRAIADGQKKVPGKMADLTEYDPMMPTATAALRTGEIVYLWGASYQAGGAAVVAHEKKTPTDGGAVLLQDGTVKTMTAAEFAAAPKAGKK